MQADIEPTTKVNIATVQALDARHHVSFRSAEDPQRRAV